MPASLSERTRVQVQLALLDDCGCETTRHDLARRASLSGLTGAEIDAARRGRSFDVTVAAAVAYACALRQGAGHRIKALALQAQHAGLGPAEQAEIAELVAKTAKGQETRDA